MYTVKHADKARGIRLPTKNSPPLAELFGIIAGDGCANHYPNDNKYALYISGDAIHDKEFLLDHVSGLIEHFFGVKPSVNWHKNHRTLTISLLSKTAVSFLLDKGIPAGFKHSIEMPRWIKKDDDLARAFLRGYFDTDGSFHLRRGKIPDNQHWEQVGATDS